MSRPPLIGMLPAELEDLAVELGSSRYRGRQIATWLYRKGIVSIDAMSDLPRDLRLALAERVSSALPAVERVTPSLDGSRKIVFRLDDGHRVSAVLMPDDGRITLCLSTQVGCGFGCAFCLTGTMGLERNLTAAEIVGQVIAANTLLKHRPNRGTPEPSSRAQMRRGGEEASCDVARQPRPAGASGELPGSDRVTHLVFMGMGEPLANLSALVAAIRILIDARLGIGYSPRRITVSTVGLASGIDRLGREQLKVNLAISLHAATDEVRSRLMPVNRSFNLAALMDAVRRYPLAPRQRIFFEYVLLDGVNDSLQDALALVRLLRDVRAKVNLIPFNDWEGSGFRRPPLSRILAFQSALLEAGITTTVRWSKGEDIGAACGQLREPVAAATGA